MNTQIERIKKIRLFLIGLTSDLSVDQLNRIPEGFNNNIAWNIGHLVAAQQGVCYIRAGISPVIDEKHFLAYKPGTKPGYYIDFREIGIIKDLLLSSLNQFETDYQKKVFENYTPWTTRYGVELTNIDDALQFLIYHEGLHIGYITALKRLVK